jgi:hypothetical protein
MTTYSIIPASDGGSFNIGIAGSDGTRQTMLGFASEAEALAWIEHDKRLSEVPNSPSAAALDWTISGRSENGPSAGPPAISLP